MAGKVTLNGELLHPSLYLAAVEFKGRDVTLTIKSIVRHDLQIRGGKSESKPVIDFEETKKLFVINKTNADSIAELYGTEAEKWVGKRVTLFPTRVKCGRETVDAIRVREVIPKAKGQAAARVPEPEPEPEPVDDQGELVGAKEPYNDIPY